MKMYFKDFIKLSFALLIILVIGGAIARADETLRLRIIHAAPGLPDVDIYVQDKLYFDNIFYRYISDYVPISPTTGADATTEDINVKIRPADTNPGYPDVIVEDVSNYDKSKDYTFIALGKLEDIQQRWVLQDDNSLPGAGTARVRIVHASFNAPTTEFCLADVCRTLAYRENTGYFLMDPGTYIPKVRLNGADPAYLEIPPLVLKDNSVHTIFMIGQVGSLPGLQLLYTFDAGDMPDPDSPSGYPPGDTPGTYPPPAYPPVTGAFLSPKLLGVIAGIVLILVGGIGIWMTRRK